MVSVENVAIFEDDFVLKPDVKGKYVYQAIQHTMKVIPNWDVIALSLNVISESRLDFFVNFSDQK